MYICTSAGQAGVVWAQFTAWARPLSPPPPPAGDIPYTPSGGGGGSREIKRTSTEVLKFLSLNLQKLNDFLFILN